MPRRPEKINDTRVAYYGKNNWENMKTSRPSGSEVGHTLDIWSKDYQKYEKKALSMTEDSPRQSTFFSLNLGLQRRRKQRWKISGCNHLMSIESPRFGKRIQSAIIPGEIRRRLDALKLLKCHQRMTIRVITGGPDTTGERTTVEVMKYATDPPN
ncbi:hypothetical protein M422DRAFT_43530 [Sphaerobolus stellatus SS14]|nr:hypothetical protein M422DRAFT_43530 [Sphaerobolus stellatus SS14]